MKLSREFTNNLRTVIEGILPPVVRDSDLFSKLMMKAVLGKNFELFYDFKQKAMKLTHQEFTEIYRKVYTEGGAIERITDLNEASVRGIQEEIVGNKLLEVGCGGGYLISKLYTASRIIEATDILISDNLIKQHPKVRFSSAAMESLPYPDNSFDTVITTHTIEHVRDLFTAISELRRVAKKRIIIVTPQQRPYRRTADLHLHFFAYPESLLAIMGPNVSNRCRVVGGDLFYVEDIAGQ